MKPSLIFGTLGMEMIAGLLAFTTPAVIFWTTHFGWRGLSESRLSFAGTPVAVGSAFNLVRQIT